MGTPFNHKEVIVNNYNVKVINGNLGREKIDNKYMNLTNKEFMDLSAKELQREIDYSWGQHDYIFNSEYIPEDIKDKQLKYLWDKIDVMTTRFVLISLKKVVK